MFRAKIARVAVNQRGRDFAVGDIHGCFTVLQRGLDHIGFNPAIDRLFAMGDLVDHGPESREVTSWLDQPWFHSICGNHELMTWRSAFNDPCSGIDHLLHGGEWLKTLTLHEQQRIARRLMALPLVIEVESAAGIVGLIHADCPFDDWVPMQSADWHKFSDIDPLVSTCLWSIDRYQAKYEGKVRNVRAVVHGHMTVPEVKILGNVYYIDTGGGTTGGEFTFLNLSTLKPMSGVR